MRLPFVRFTTQWMILLAIGAAATSAAWLAGPLPSVAQANQAAPQEKMTLLGTLSDWKYPGSNLHAGARMSDGGNPSVADVRCEAILTTPDPVEKVVK